MSTTPRPAAATFRGQLAATYQHWYAASLAIPLDGVTRELIAIRTSSLNGCSFCLRMHLASARKLGCTQAWMDTIPAWRTSSIFSAKERAILAWADAVTVIGDHHDDAAYAELAAHATAEEICLITAHIAQNNLWNRLPARCAGNRRRNRRLGKELEAEITRGAADAAPRVFFS